MFKKIKRNFLILNMFIISVLMILVCFFIYITMRFNMLNQINEEMLLVEQNYQNFYSLPSFKNSIVSGDNLDLELYPATSSSLFVVDINEPYQIHYYTGINCDDTDLMKGITQSCLKTNDDKGTVVYNEKFYYFSKIRFGTTSTRIIVLDIDEKMRVLNELFINILFVGTISLSLIFIISNFFTNKSMKSLEDAFIKQKHFVSDVSHELKTPIAVIKTNLDVLKKEGNISPEGQKWLSYAIDETNQMSEMINEFLYLAKVESIVENKLDDIIDLSSIVNTVLLSMEAIAFEKKIIIDENVKDDIFVKGHNEDIKRLIKILIDNAIKYCNETGTIVVSLEKYLNSGVFLVKNTGTVIDSKDKDVIFEKFYRVNKERERTSQSYGIGLSIAKSTCERHKFNIRAYPENNMTCFKLSFRTINKPANKT